MSFNNDTFSLRRLAPHSSLKVWITSEHDITLQTNSFIASEKIVSATTLHCTQTCMFVASDEPVLWHFWRWRRTRFALEMDSLALETNALKTRIWASASHAQRTTWDHVTIIIIINPTVPTDPAWKVLWPEQHKIELVWPYPVFAETFPFLVRLVVKNGIPQYGVTVVKNKKMCCSVNSCFNTKKALLTSKQNSFVLFSKLYLLLRLSYTSAKVLARSRMRTVHNFATFWFGTLVNCSHIIM